MLFGVYVGSTIACLVINVSVIKSLEKKISNAGYRIVNDKRLIKKDIEDVSSSFLPFLNLVIAFFELRTLINNDVFGEFLKDAIQCGVIEKIEGKKSYIPADDEEFEFEMPLYFNRKPSTISRPLTKVKKR